MEGKDIFRSKVLNHAAEEKVNKTEAITQFRETFLTTVNGFRAKVDHMSYGSDKNGENFYVSYGEMNNE